MILPAVAALRSGADELAEAAEAPANTDSVSGTTDVESAEDAAEDMLVAVTEELVVEAGVVGAPVAGAAVVCSPASWNG